MFAVLRQRNFALVWIAGIISLLGDYILGIVLPFYVYAHTGSPLATGTTFMMEVIPRLLFGSVAGVFVDRWRRRYTMIVADVARALVILILLIVTITNWIWIIYVVAFVEAVFSAFFEPAKGSLLPQLVKEQDLMQANGLSQVSSNAVGLIGPLLGGVLFVWSGLQGVVVIDAVSYVLSGVCIACITFVEIKKTVLYQKEGNTFLLQGLTFWREWLEGYRLLMKQRWLLVLIVVAGIAMMGNGFFNVLDVIFVREVLHGGAQVFSLIVSASAAGGLIGGLMISKVGKKMTTHHLFALSLVTTGIFSLTYVNVSWLLLNVALVAAMGISVVGWIVSLTTMAQLVDNAYRGRVMSTYGTTQTLLMLAGMGGSALLSGAIGVVHTLDIAGGLFVLSGLLAALVLRAPNL